MARNVRDVCIVGIGETEYRKWGSITDRSELGLACEAIKAAAADAGVETDDIDGLASYAYDHSEPYMLQETLGLPNLNYAAMVWGGGGNGSFGSIALAYSAIRAGHVECVAVFRSLCQGQTFRFGQGYPTAHQNFIHPFGMLSPPLMFAPVAQRYKHLYGVRDEQFGEVALVCRDNASRNPRAVFRDRPLTMTDYLQSRMIADPLRLYDCCQENDGACALILTTLERARDLKQKPIAVLAAGHGGDPGRGSGPLGFHNMPDEIYAHGDGTRLAQRLYGLAGVRPDDIDVAQIYDAYTPLILMALENYGFCGRGEGKDFVSSGGIRWPDGGLPINTSGGLLSEAYIHGLNLAVEGVRQLRGQSTSQVRDAELCLLTCGTSAAILGA